MNSPRFTTACLWQSSRPLRRTSSTLPAPRPGAVIRPSSCIGITNGRLDQIRPEEILIQEIIPGDGREQYSWCAFVRHGQPHSTLTARRLRQHPREFGRAATYVETIEAPAIEDSPSVSFGRFIFDGLVEIEYKRDPRDGRYKLLDVNARAWGFHALGAACGVDFPWLLYADKMGLPVDPVRGKPGVGWLRILTDIPTALSDLVHGCLSLPLTSDRCFPPAWNRSSLGPIRCRSWRKQFCCPTSSPGSIRQNRRANPPKVKRNNACR